MEILDQIYQAVQETNSKVNELVEWKAGMDERMSNLVEMTKGVRRTVYGNPNNGLVGKVQQLLNCKESSMSWRNFWLYILRVVIAAAILGVMGFLLVLYAKFGKGA